MNKRVAYLAFVAVSLLSGLTAADEPNKKPLVNPGATTKPIEPGDVGQTTVAPSGKNSPLPVAVRWWGHACISIETFWGFTVIVDPFPESTERGYPKLKVNADLVLVSHEAPDHCAVSAVGGKPVVLHGMAEDGKTFNTIDHVLDRLANEPSATVRTRAQVSNPSWHAVSVKGIGVHHEAPGGQDAGGSMMFLIEVNGVRILHGADVGHKLTPELVKAVGAIDVLILPVGGGDTLDAAGAVGVAKQLQPKAYLWPVHFGPDTVAATADTVDALVEEARRANLLIRDVRGNTAAVSALPSDAPPPIGLPAVVLMDYQPLAPEAKVRQMLKSLRDDRRALIDTLGKVSKEQLDHRPSDGSHTIRWNFEHTTARELGLFSQIYNALDPEVPVINWNPAQMPRDFKAHNPAWGPEEIVRHVRRVGAFTERFSYLLADAPPTMRVEGTRFSLDYLTAMIVGHYQNHTSKAVHKFTLPDWPRK